MNALDSLRALAVGVTVFLGTLLLSIPMVAFYAYVIEPGHPEEFYKAAAQWIAPWSSHIAGPILFFWLNLRGAVRRPHRNAVAFAGATIVGYLLVDLAAVPIFGLAWSTVITPTFVVSLAIKAAAAFAGATLGARRTARTAG